MKPSRVKKPLLAASVALGTLLAGEAVARLALGEAFQRGVLTDLPMNVCVAPDPELGWRGRADLDAWCAGPTLDLVAFEYAVRTDAQGYRTPRSLDQASPHARILILGDSIAWGWGVAAEDTFAQHLQVAVGERASVHGLGVPGYGTDQQLLLLERVAPALRPTHVVLAYTLNDAEGNAATEQYGLPKPALVARGGAWTWTNRPVAEPWPDGWAGPLDSWSLRLRSRSALLQLLGRPRVASGTPVDPQWADAEPEQLATYLRNQEAPIYSPAQIQGLVAEVKRRDSVTFELLSRLAERCATLNADLHAIAVPHHHDQYLLIPRLAPSTRARRALAGEGPFRTDLTLALAEAGEALGFGVLDVDQAFLQRVQAEGANLNAGDGHINAEGHRIVGQALAQALEDDL